MEKEGSIPKSFKLNDGTTIPSVGLGTASHQDKDSMVNAVMNAGYIHIDTAACYNNEHVVGEALAECFAQGKTRADVYVTTKLWHDKWDNPEAALKDSLAKL